MKLTTTHHLGRQPGRARLGVCGHLRTNPAVSFRNGNRTGSWQCTALAPAAPAIAAMVGTSTGAGVGSIKRTTWHLGTGST